MSVVSPLLMSLLAVTMETVWCQDHVFSREQLTQALSKLTERVTELEEKEKEAGELGKLVEQLGDKMTEGIGKLGDKMTEGIGDLGEQLKENLGKINVGLDKIGDGVENIGEILHPKPASCVDVREYDTSNSVHTLTVNNRNIKVFCHQQTSGGGWTVLQRRQDGSVDFNRNWTDYENGFGDLNGEFWLGLSNIHRLTSSDNYSLRVDLTDWDNTTAYALYDTFYIDGPDQNYTLHVDGYSGTAGDCLIKAGTGYKGEIHNNQPFSTPDRDHDQNRGNCAARWHSGWWYNTCLNANLNGQYGQSGSRAWKYIVWYAWHKDIRSYKEASMMIKARS